MKTYMGHRPGEVVILEDHQPHRPLRWRLDLRNHSPTGLEWGYGGSGPSQLALAILADALGDAFAVEHYQAYKWDVIARMPYDGWEISEINVRTWAQSTERQGSPTEE